MRTTSNVLIIDDDEISNYVAEQAIKSIISDIEIITVLNGMEAINYFKSHPEDLPKYVLLDINMPLMNGFEFLSWYESSIYKGASKIMMFTTSIRKKERDRATEFDDVIAYIEKPLSDNIITHYFRAQ